MKRSQAYLQELKAFHENEMPNRLKQTAEAVKLPAPQVKAALEQIYMGTYKSKVSV